VLILSWRSRMSCINCSRVLQTLLFQICPLTGSTIWGCINYLWAAHPFCLYSTVQRTCKGYCYGSQNFLYATYCLKLLNGDGYICFSVRLHDCYPLFSHKKLLWDVLIWYEKKSCDGGLIPLKKFWGFLVPSLEDRYLQPFSMAWSCCFSTKRKKMSATFLLYMAMFITIVPVDVWTCRNNGRVLPPEVMGYSGRWIWGTSATGQRVSCGECSCTQSTDEEPLACFYAHFIALVLRIYLSNGFG